MRKIIQIENRSQLLLKLKLRIRKQYKIHSCT